MNATITANDLKVKGVTLLESVIKKNDGAIISVRGKEQYIVLRLSDYNHLRELELDAALKESREDIKNGKIHTDGVFEHLKRIADV